MVTEDEWSGEVAKSARFRLISPIIALGAFGLIFIPCMMAGQALASGIYADLVAVGILLGIMFPLAFVLVVMGENNQRRTDEKVRNLNAELSDAVADAERLNNELSEAMSDADRQAEIRDAQVQRQRFESRLANALDMAEGEPEVIEVIERSFATVLPDAPAELLLADNSHAHLHRMAAVGPEGKPPSCGVDSPDRCPAARRAQTQVFADSDHLDACPKLRNRPEGRLSALCVPVSIMGRTVGVIHATGEAGEEGRRRSRRRPGHAGQAGRRPHRPAPGHGRDPAAGLDRHADRTAQPAVLLPAGRRRSRRTSTRSPWPWPTSTTSRSSTTPTGTRPGTGRCGCSARVLRDSLRTSDVASRYGGEEFAIAFPDCSAVDAARALNTVRTQLDAAITVGGLPKFTVSFGVTECEPGEELATILRRADDALLQAKHEGRDRVVLHDAMGETALAPTGGREGIISFLEDDYEGDFQQVD